MHKVIGLLGGMSPESTVTYYEYITRTYTNRYGDYGYPQMVIWSADFQHIIELMTSGSWDIIGKELGEAALQLQNAGVDLISVATNTMHYVIKDIMAAIDIPVVNLLDAVADTILASDLHKVGLVGTRYAMELPYYKDSLGEKNIEVIIPNKEERDLINKVIFEELVAGIIKEESKRAYLDIIGTLQDQGAEAVILGCTEIPLLVTQDDTELPLLDSTIIHAEAILNFAISG